MGALRAKPGMGPTCGGVSEGQARPGPLPSCCHTRSIRGCFVSPSLPSRAVGLAALQTAGRGLRLRGTSTYFFFFSAQVFLPLSGPRRSGSRMLCLMAEDATTWKAQHDVLGLGCRHTQLLAAVNTLEGEVCRCPAA